MGRYHAQPPHRMVRCSNVQKAIRDYLLEFHGAGHRGCTSDVCKARFPFVPTVHPLFKIKRVAGLSGGVQGTQSGHRI